MTGIDEQAQTFFSATPADRENQITVIATRVSKALFLANCFSLLVILGFSSQLVRLITYPAISGHCEAASVMAATLLLWKSSVKKIKLPQNGGLKRSFLKPYI